MNDFPTIADLVYGDGNTLSGWLLYKDLFIPGGINIFNDENQDYYSSVLASVKAKALKAMYVSCFFSTRASDRHKVMSA